MGQQPPAKPRLATPADDDLLVSLVTHPQVARWNSPDGGAAFDPKEFTAHPTNFALIVAGGCFLARALEQGAFAIHTNFLPDARGAHALRESREALRYAFLATPAEQLVTMVPADNPVALWFAHGMGFRDTYRRANAWVKGGERFDVQYMRLDIDDWVLADDACKAQGDAFHHLLGDEVTHASDDVHDAFVGAGVLMVANSLIDKAVRIYGRWARAAGYQPFAVHTREPLVLDVGTHLAHVEGERYTLEKK
jgi:hypothetical protein